MDGDSSYNKTTSIIVNNEIDDMKHRQDLIMSVFRDLYDSVSEIRKRYSDVYFYYDQDKFLKYHYTSNSILLINIAKHLYPDVVAKAYDVYNTRLISGNYNQKMIVIGRIIYFLMKEQESNIKEYSNALEEIEARTGQALFVDGSSFKECIDTNKVITNINTPPSSISDKKRLSHDSLMLIQQLKDKRLTLLFNLYEDMKFNKNISSLMNELKELNNKIKSVSNSNRGGQNS